MILFYLITLIFQNEIIAAPTKQPMQEQFKKLENQVQSLMNENKDFKRQIESLIETKVKLFDTVQQQGKLVEKSAYERNVISSAVDQIKTTLDKSDDEQEGISLAVDQIKTTLDKSDYEQEGISSAVEQIKTTLGSVVELITCEITINVVSKNIEYEQWREKNLSGCYNMVEVVNGRPDYKRVKQTEDGLDIYLWYYVSESEQNWRLTSESAFIDRTANAFMFNSSEATIVTNLDRSWTEHDGSDWEPTATVTIVSNKKDLLNNLLITSTVDKKPEDYNLPSDYICADNSWGKSFFKIYPAMAYRAAKAQCESDGTYLAVPRSEAENDFIASLIPNESIWIGINDIEKEGSFVAVDGRKVSWTKWDSDEPSEPVTGWLHGEDAVEIWQDNDHQTIPKSWNDAHIDLLRKFVCFFHI